MPSDEGTSPLPSPAGVAQTPVAAPVGSGHVGFAGSAFAPEKYPGSAGAAGAAGSAGAASVAGSAGAASAAATSLCLCFFFGASSSAARAVDVATMAASAAAPRNFRYALFTGYPPLVRGCVWGRQLRVAKFVPPMGGSAPPSKGIDG